MSSQNDFYQLFMEKPEDEANILSNAAMELTGKDLETLKSRISNKKTKDAKKAGKKPVADDKSVVGTDSSFVQVEPKRDLEREQKLVDAFWLELEGLDPSSLVSTEVTDAFKYVGFDPDVVLREMLYRGQRNGKNGKAIQKDLVDIVTIAIIKGSVTEKNLKKTSDSGKVFYKALQDVYGLATGGAKGKDSTHVTVARVAAAVPGVVTQILIKKPEFSKTFVGPFGSKSLPPYLRHQAAAACIPEQTSEKLKDYLLGLITAFTADQSKTLSNTKDKPEDLFDNQLNYILTTYNSKHPSEAQRKKIFAGFSLSNDFEKLNTVATRIKKIKTDFQTLTQQELDAELNK
jgi:hypothetical protein